jgi:hypothetical protein
LDFLAIGGKKQRHGCALIGAGVTGFKALGLKTPNSQYWGLKCRIMAELVSEMIGVSLNIQIAFRKKDRVGIAEKVLIVEVQHHEEEGPSAGLV